MPDVVHQLERSIYEFELFCIDIIYWIEVRSESGTAMTTVTSDISKVYEEVCEAFEGDISGGFGRRDWTELMKTFLKVLA